MKSIILKAKKIKKILALSGGELTRATPQKEGTFVRYPNTFNVSSKVQP